MIITRVLCVDVPGLGLKIRDRRMKDSRAVATLAKAAEMTSVNWYRIENEQQSVPIETLCKIERVLNTDFGVNFLMVAIAQLLKEIKPVNIGPMVLKAFEDRGKRVDVDVDWLEFVEVGMRTEGEMRHIRQQLLAGDRIALADEPFVLQHYCQYTGESLDHYAGD